MSDIGVNIEELLPFYLLGTLTPDEVERVEAYLESNPDARKWVQEMSPVLETLAISAGTVEPNPATKQELLARLESGRKTLRLRSGQVTDQGRMRQEARSGSATGRLGLRERLRLVRLEPVVLAVSLIVAVISLAWAAAVNGRIVELRREVTDLQASLADQGQVIRFLSSPGSRTVLIAGTEIQPGAQAQMIFAPDSQAGGLLIEGLSPLPADQVYQLWLIEADAPQSAGTFSVDPGGKATVLVEAARAIADFDALGVSVEPAGGSPQPTGEIVLLSNLSGDA
jgi:anti-sigma-K factor RskA